MEVPPSRHDGPQAESRNFKRIFGCQLVDRAWRYSQFIHHDQDSGDMYSVLFCSRFLPWCIHDPTNQDDPLVGFGLYRESVGINRHILQGNLPSDHRSQRIATHWRK